MVHLIARKSKTQRVVDHNILSLLLVIFNNLYNPWLHHYVKLKILYCVIYHQNTSGPEL
jgi:hypothetical protein